MREGRIRNEGRKNKEQGMKGKGRQGLKGDRAGRGTLRGREVRRQRRR